MLKIFSAYQNKLIIRYFLNTIANNSADPGAIFYEIQLILLMLVQRICKL